MLQFSLFKYRILIKYQIHLSLKNKETKDKKLQQANKQTKPDINYILKIDIFLEMLVLNMQIPFLIAF